MYILVSISSTIGPGVVAQIQSVARLAWQAAGWNNTIISDRSHEDKSASTTIVVALSDPDSSYDGGEFYIETSDLETFTFRPPRLLAVVFISETQHGFKESTRGARETFATELLIHDDATFGMKRLNFHEWSRMLREFNGQGYLDDYDNNELIEAEEDANN